MIKTVISSKSIDEHNIEPYRFKVLGSTVEPKVKPPTDEEKKPEPSVVVAPEPVKAVESAFVEELLKKTDELSTNIIKLQLKIESQEVEFEKRLNEEVRRAKEEGVKEGELKAKEEQRDFLQGLQTQFSRSIHLLEEERHRFVGFLEKTEKELSEAAIDVAKEVIKKELKQEATAVSIALSKALVKELADATKLELRVNPRDYEGVKEAYGAFEHIKIGTDDAIAQGGVIVLSDVGNIDGTIGARLEKVKQMMKE